LFEVWNKAYNGELPHCSKGKSKKIANTSNSAIFASHKRETDMLTWTIAGTWDYVLDYWQ